MTNLPLIRFAANVALKVKADYGLTLECVADWANILDKAFHDGRDVPTTAFLVANHVQAVTY